MTFSHERPELELRGIRKTYPGHVAVESIDLVVSRGEFLSLLGPSGCGKTTTLRMIAGFVSPTAGTIAIRGQDVTRLEPYKRDTAMVFQDYALFPHMSVFDNVAFGLKRRKVSKSEIRERVGSMLDLVELSGREERLPGELSGGQQQRVALARALVLNAAVVLLDEPLSNLDAKLRASTRFELRRLQQEIGFTAIFVTHDQEEAMAISDRIAVMSDGRIEQIGTTREIYQTPATPFVAGFIGSANLFAGEVTNVAGSVISIQTPIGVLRGHAAGDNGGKLRPGDAAQLVIRSEAIRLEPGTGPDVVDEDENRVSGLVDVVSYLGATSEFSIRAAQNTRIEVHQNDVDAEAMRHHSQVQLSWRVEHSHVFQS